MVNILECRIVHPMKINNKMLIILSMIIGMGMSMSDMNKVIKLQ